MTLTKNQKSVGTPTKVKLNILQLTLAILAQSGRYQRNTRAVKLNLHWICFCWIYFTFIANSISMGKHVCEYMLFPNEMNDFVSDTSWWLHTHQLRCLIFFQSGICNIYILITPKQSIYICMNLFFVCLYKCNGIKLETAYKQAPKTGLKKNISQGKRESLIMFSF